MSGAGEILMTMQMDPNEITSSGLHPFGRIFAEPSAEKPAASVSVWQVLYNPAAGTGNVMFFQSPELTAAVARWIADPGTNFGLIVIGNETTGQTTKAMVSREHPDPSLRPVLELTLRSGVRGAARLR